MASDPDGRRLGRLAWSPPEPLDVRSPPCSQRLARTMYRRRRCVLGGLDRPADRHLRALEQRRRRVQDRVQAARHREPGRVRPAREVELPRPPGAGADRLRGRAAASTTPAVQQAMEGLFAEIEQKIPDVDGRRARTPHEGARQIARNGEDRVRARSTSPTARARSSPPTARRSRSSRDDDRRARARDRVRRRHVRRPAEIGGASEAIGLLAAMIILLHRVRLGARDGSADRHRAVRHRHRRRDRAESCAPSSTCPTSPPRPSR